MTKYQKQILLSANKNKTNEIKGFLANKKAQIFLLEILFVFVLFLSFIVAYSTTNTNIDNTKVINYYKVHDIFVVSVAKQLDPNGIQDLIRWYLPNTDYYIKESSNTIKHITDKKECYAKYIHIWKDYPVKKHTIYIKICF